MTDVFISQEKKYNNVVDYIYSKTCVHTHLKFLISFERPKYM